MTRAPLLERSLAVVNPEVAGQLHPTRNGPVDARLLAAGSPVRLWWTCPAGHEWQTRVVDRARGTGCPACGGRRPTPDTCLAARNPVLAAQWHPWRNDPLTAADVLPSSNRRVWWQCSRGHDWATQVTARTRGTGCPDCSRPQPAPALLTRRPDLAAQWDTTVNGELTPAVTAGSKRRVGWRCAHGHRWMARIDSRSSGAGCPACAGRVTTPETAFGVRYPHLLDEWAGELNGDLDPATLGPGVSRRVWWRCLADPDHVWQAAVADRGARATGCPFCTGRRVTAQTCLAAVHPEVAADWDPDRNGDRIPATVHPTSNTDAWWRCPAGHTWAAQIASRTAGGSGCPYCAGRRATPATSLAVTHPNLAAQWDPARNGDLTPAAVRPGSSIGVWWRCPVGHSWRAQIYQRAGQHTGCPVCASHANHGQLLVTTRPDLAAQWSHLLNAGGPGALTTGSHVKAWWRCPTDPRHLWWAAVVGRARGTGCPYCAHTRPTPTTCLAGVAPHLLGDWHPTRNGALSPTDVLPYSGVPVWWQCAEHHEWAVSPAARLTGTGHGCPDCAARARPPVRRPVESIP